MRANPPTSFSCSSITVVKVFRCECMSCVNTISTVLAVSAVSAYTGCVPNNVVIARAPVSTDVSTVLIFFILFLLCHTLSAHPWQIIPVPSARIIRSTTEYMICEHSISAQKPSLSSTVRNEKERAKPHLVSSAVLPFFNNSILHNFYMNVKLDSLLCL